MAQTVRCDDSDNDPRVNAQACRALGARSMVAVPLTAKGRVVGLIEAFSSKTHGFNEADVKSLNLLGELILAAIHPEEEDRLAQLAEKILPQPPAAVSLSARCGEDHDRVVRRSQLSTIAAVQPACESRLAVYDGCADPGASPASIPVAGSCCIQSRLRAAVELPAISYRIEEQKHRGPALHWLSGRSRNYYSSRDHGLTSPKRSAR